MGGQKWPPIFKNWRRAVHKVTIEVPDDMYDDLVELVPWGNRQRIYIHIIRLLTEAIKRDGPIVIGALLADSFSIVWNPDQWDRPKIGQSPFDDDQLPLFAEYDPDE